MFVAKEEVLVSASEFRHETAGRVTNDDVLTDLVNGSHAPKHTRSDYPHRCTPIYMYFFIGLIECDVAENKHLFIISPNVGLSNDYIMVNWTLAERTRLARGNSSVGFNHIL